MSLTNKTSKIINNSPTYSSSAVSNDISSSKPTTSSAGMSNTSGTSKDDLQGNTNMIPKLMSNKYFFIFIILIILCLVILTFLALFNPLLFTSSNGVVFTDEKLAATVSIVVFFVTIAFGLCIYFLPGLKEIKNFLGQLKMVILIVLYTVFLILLFRLIPEDTMNKYSYIITPTTMITALILFYNGFTSNYLKEYNIAYERIKTIILFLCFISILCVYYYCNTGGFVQYYFRPITLLTILLSFFAFLYVIIILGLPDKDSGNKTNAAGNIFSKFPVYGSIGFVIYLIVSIIGFMYLNGDLNKKTINPKLMPETAPVVYAKAKANIQKGAKKINTNNQNNQNNGLFLDLSFLKIGGKEHKIEVPLLTSYITDYDSVTNTVDDILFNTNTSGYNPSQPNNYTEGFDNLHDFNNLSDTSIANLISGNSTDTPEKTGSLTLAIVFILITTLIFGTTLLVNIFPESVDYFNTTRDSNLNEASLFKRSLLILFGLVISGLFITWLVYYIHSLTSQSSVGVGITSFILNLLLILIVLILLYKIYNASFPSNAANAKKNEIFNFIINIILYIPFLFSVLFDSIVSFITGKEQSTTTTSALLIIVAIIIFIVYIKLPGLEESISLQGGQLILNRPVSITTMTPLATFSELNGSTDIQYEYGLSFWFYIDAMAPNTSPAYAAYTSILSCGNKPTISYNPSENKLRITMEKIERTVIDTNSTGKKTEYDDSYTQEIVYEKENILLQKCNNEIINYSGGTLDIFLNNDLMKSVNGIVPYMKNEPLTVGSENGLYGGMCNVVYFKHSLTSSQMYYLYNTVKNKSPPIANNSAKQVVFNKSIISSSN